METVVEGLRFPESPRWHDGALWFSDMHERTVLRLDMARGTTAVVAEVAGKPSGLGWDRDGRLLVVSMTDRRLLHLEAGGDLVEVADLSAVATAYTNDMVVDRRGRAYIGNAGFDRRRCDLGGVADQRRGPARRRGRQGACAGPAARRRRPNAQDVY